MTKEEAEFTWALLHPTAAEGPLRLCFKMPDAYFSDVSASSPTSLREITERIKDADTYVCLNPCTPHSRKPSKGDVLLVRWIGIDLDPLDTPSHYPLTAIDNLRMSLAKLQTNPWSYSIALNSGRGVQLWIKMLETTNITMADDCIYRLTRFLIDDCTAQLAKQGYRIDPACAEVSHIFRLPGTRNSKTGGTSFYYAMVNPPECLDWAVLRPLAGRGPQPAPTVASPPPGKEMFWLAAQLCPTARHFLLFGTDTNGDSRHKACFVAAKNLKELNTNPDVAEILLMIGASKCNPPLPSHDWSRIFRQVFGDHQA
jgi:hypothetical protein